MSQNQITARNHYVPESYLERWAGEGRKVWVYRLLVPNQNMQVWDQKSVRSVGAHHHLYTRIVEGRENDEIENWLSKDFESPSRDPILRAIRNERLSEADWTHIIRFLAAQDARTPVRLTALHQRLTERLPILLNESLSELERALTQGATAPLQTAGRSYDSLLPIRVEQRQDDGDSAMATLQAHVLLGRGTALFGLRVLLDRTIRALHAYRWTILRAPDGIRWLTSDNPVVKLTIEANGRYRFSTAWGIPGTTIFMPLSPTHLLYTVAGSRPPPKGEVVAPEFAEQVQHWIVQNASRHVFATESSTLVEQARPRTVSLDLYTQEKQFWSRFHEEQTAAEREFHSSRSLG
jgi:hypothetical protein